MGFLAAKSNLKDNQKYEICEKIGKIHGGIYVVYM